MHKRGVYRLSKIIYNKGEFVIFSVHNGYIVYNTEKDFKEGHTHLRNFKSAKSAIYFVGNKRAPHKTSIYYLTSLVRIANDVHYKSKVQDLIDTRIQKGKKEPIIKRSK